MSALGQKRTLRRLRFKERQIERREHQDNSDVHHQPRPELVPEEQDVHADHNAYQREHVKYDGSLSAHLSFLLRAAGVEPERRLDYRRRLFRNVRLGQFTPIATTKADMCQWSCLLYPQKRTLVSDTGMSAKRQERT